MFSFHFLLIITVAVVSIIAFPESEAATKDASVIILGAGVAGIQAAAQLTQQGITDILIIESTGRIGGRMWNEEWEGLTIELGCNWIEGTPLSENPLWTIAQKINLQGASTQQEDTPLMYDHLGKADTKITKDIWTRLNSALAATYIESLQRQWNNRPDLSLREALTSNGWKPTTALERVAEYYYVDWNFEYGSEDISLFNFFSADAYLSAASTNTATNSTDTDTDTEKAPRAARHKKLRRRMAKNVRTVLQKMGVFTGDPDDPEWFVTDSRGYIAVLQYIADSFLVPNDKRLILNTTVSKIQYNSNGSSGVTITTTNGKVYTSDYAICTFSAGVINKGFNNGLFSPAVPKWKSTAYGKAEMGIYTKIFLKYPKPFWDDWVYTLYADPDTYGYYPVWQNMQALGLFFPNSSNIFMVTTTNTESTRLEGQDLNKTISEAGLVLKAMYDISTAESTAIDVRVPIWSKNPNFYGSYSNLVVGTEGSDYVDMEKSIGGLWFAGEATDWDWNGFVTGAYFSGDRVAKCVAKTKKTGLAVPCPQN